MTDGLMVVLFVLLVIQIILFKLIGKKNKYWLYTIISVLATVIILRISLCIEEIVNLNSPGLGEIGTGIIMALFRIITLVQFGITIFRGIIIYLDKRNISKNGNYRCIKFIIKFLIILISLMIFTFCQVISNNLGG